jgi:hypothetical protein
MKKIILIIAFFLRGVFALAQLPDGFDKTGTMFPNINMSAGFKYVLIDPATKPAHVIINKVVLKKSLYTKPEQTDLTIDVYNVLFNKNELAVFSVMPSLFVKSPAWKKINIINIKSEIITLSNLRDTMRKKFEAYPVKDRGIVDPLKYYNYILIIKKADGYYLNTTDCITEFFEITKDNDKLAPFKIDTGAKMISISEYESGYRRKHAEYSSNFTSSENSYFNDDVKERAIFNLSYIFKDKGQSVYKFWLLDQWILHNSNFRRGMDRFVFKPGVGIIGASYDFYMNKIISYWYNENKVPSNIIKGSAEDKLPYNITPYFSVYNPALLDYLNEDVIKYSDIIKM